MPEGWKSRFSEPEMRHAASVGVERQLLAIRLGRPDRYGAEKRNGFGMHIEGAHGEQGTAKMLNVYWDPVVEHQLYALPGDVGVYQVRTTTRPRGCLIIHREDSDQARFYLVVLNLPEFTVVGWALGADCKRPRFWRDDVPDPAFFVPQDELRSPEFERPQQSEEVDLASLEAVDQVSVAVALQ